MKVMVPNSTNESAEKVDIPGFHNEDSFYECFRADLKNSQALVLIQSPFLGERRLRLLESDLQDCIKRLVRVCVFIQEPSVMRGNSDSEARFRKVQGLIDLLRSWGIHVSFRRSIHAKLVIIDETILWEGSLNSLSHGDSTERMVRWCDRKIVLDAILMNHLDSCDSCRVRDRALRCVPDEISEAHQRKAIGAMLGKRRKDLGLTQRSLAERSGTSQTSVSLLESGKGTATLDVLLKVGAQLQLELRLAPWFQLPSIDEALSTRQV